MEAPQATAPRRPDAESPPLQAGPRPGQPARRPSGPTRHYAAARFGMTKLGTLIDRGVIALTLLTAASLLSGSYATASHTRELLPVAVVTSD